MEGKYKVELQSVIKPDESFGIEESEWQVNVHEETREVVTEAIEALADKMRDRYSETALCVLIVEAPNNNQRHTARGPLHDLDSTFLTNSVFFLMTQSGRVDYRLQQLKFKLQVFNGTHGKGRASNGTLVLDSSNTRSIIQITTLKGETNCLARCLVVGIAVKGLQEVFKGNLTESEIKALNYKKANKTQLQEGILSETELDQIKKGSKYKIQGILADVLHRLSGVPVKEDGNDFTDLEVFAKYLGVHVVVYDYISKKRMFDGGAQGEAAQTINLVYNRLHYDYLVTVTLAFGEQSV